VKEVALKILNNGREYIMDLQCIKQVDSAKGVFFLLWNKVTEIHHPISITGYYVFITYAVNRTIHGSS